MARLARAEGEGEADEHAGEPEQTFTVHGYRFSATKLRALYLTVTARRRRRRRHCGQGLLNRGCG